MEEKILQIYLDETSQIKQEIIGHVILSPNQPLELFCLTVSLTGLGSIETRHRCQYCESSGHNIEQTRSCEMYIRDKVYLLGDSCKMKLSCEVGTDCINLKKMPTTVVESGCHKFYFGFHIPGNLPSSFNGRNCSIDYFLEAAVFLPTRNKMSYTEQTAMVPVIIRGNLDLNSVPEINEESEGTRTRKTSCFFSQCFSQESVDLTVSLRRRGYVCGEKVPFIFHIINKSGKRVAKTQARLVQYVLTYPPEEKALYTKRDSVVNTVEKSTEDSSKSEGVWTSNIEIPVDSPISQLGGSKIIDVQYGLQIVVTLSGCIKQTVWVEVPILVGTVPLRKPNMRPSMLENSVGGESQDVSTDGLQIGNAVPT